MNRDFEKILDEAEKNMDEPDMILAFVLVGLDKNPKMRIQELLHLKDIYDERHKNSRSPMTKGDNNMSRAERRATERKNKKKNRL